MKLQSIIAATLSLTGIAASAVSAEDLLLTGAHIIDPESREVAVGNLLIRDGKIAGRPDGRPAGFAGRVVALDAKWVMPAFVDLHTHSFGDAVPGGRPDGVGTPVIANHYLYAGTTAFLDLFGHEQGLMAMRASQRAGEFGGADLYASLSCLTAPEGHCTEYGVPTRTMSSPEEARASVADLAGNKPDVVKFVYAQNDDMPSIDKATLVAGIDEARKHGIKTVVHVQTWQDMRDAVAAGATAVTHTPKGEMPADIPALLVAHGTVSIPTITVHNEYLNYFFDSAVLEAPLAQELASDRVKAAYRDEGMIARYKPSYDERKARNMTTLRSVGALAEGGVTVLLGTDGGNWGTVQGYSVHREMIKLSEAGLDNWQVLAAASTGAADFLGLDYGVEDGALANLVVLDASPLDSIVNTQAIALVVKDGEVVDRETLLAQPE
ncbi:amidohydrolase family protein [Kordiimonas aestuarii]|uniref:amidohydrolase family protein n=1 Tax=Kordiimonas aestuarii TaxID=1005925 RepID=UPI0021D118D2|nr:amidohydrolase family protein [Kordiimonas aestuarii]